MYEEKYFLAKIQKKRKGKLVSLYIFLYLNLKKRRTWRLATVGRDDHTFLFVFKKIFFFSFFPFFLKKRKEKKEKPIVF